MRAITKAIASVIVGGCLCVGMSYHVARCVSLALITPFDPHVRYIQTHLVLWHGDALRLGWATRVEVGGADGSFVDRWPGVIISPFGTLQEPYPHWIRRSVDILKQKVECHRELVYPDSDEGRKGSGLYLSN